MSSKTLNGILLKGIGGFYSVEAADAVYICKARGVFRKKRITPLSGDRVQITVSDSDADELRRPPVANIDNLIIVVSTTAPRPSPFVIDKLIALAEQKEIEPIVVFTKTDIVPTDTLFEVYRKAGIPCFAVSNQTGEGVEAVRALLHGKISAFTGNSGVGKTSLLNRIAPNLRRETGEISDKLGADAIPRRYDSQGGFGRMLPRIPSVFGGVQVHYLLPYVRQRLCCFGGSGARRNQYLAPQ